MSFLRGLLTENISYKLVSLFIAVILWVTILGRRDFIYTKTLDLDFRTAPGMTVAGQSADRIRVRVAGPRASLRKFMESTSNPALVVDLLEQRPGIVDVDIPSTKIEVPVGVKILGVRPNMIRVEVVDTDKARTDQ